MISIVQYYKAPLGSWPWSLFEKWEWGPTTQTEPTAMLNWRDSDIWFQSCGRPFDYRNWQHAFAKGSSGREYYGAIRDFNSAQGYIFSIFPLPESETAYLPLLAIYRKFIDDEGAIMDGLLGCHVATMQPERISQRYGHYTETNPYICYLNQSVARGHSDSFFAWSWLCRDASSWLAADPPLPLRGPCPRNGSHCVSGGRCGIFIIIIPRQNMETTMFELRTAANFWPWQVTRRWLFDGEMNHMLHTSRISRPTLIEYSRYLWSRLSKMVGSFRNFSQWSKRLGSSA